MNTIETLRNLKAFPTSDAALADLRQNRWSQYQPAEPISRIFNGQEFQLRPGLTLTPFANAKPCNAHCRFCSEELIRKDGKVLTSKRLIRDYDQYFEGLKNALLDIGHMPIGLSLSGLEATQEPEWLLRLLQTFEEAAPHFQFDEKVLYTNGIGLYKHPEVIEAIAKANFDRIELSRCHFDEAINQSIMYFNRNEPVWQNAGYEAMLANVLGRVPVKNSCLLSKTGIHDVEQIEQYLDWAKGLGIRKVVFREFSQLDDSYQSSTTTAWIDANRVPITPILAEIAPSLSKMRAGWLYQSSTLGYYYYNENFLYGGCMEVILETSSYPALMSANGKGLVQKLVFHSNGNLCGDWDPDSMVLANYFGA